MIGETRHPPDEAHTRSFVHELREANPAGAELLDRHAAKAGIARALRAMRTARGMTQDEVSIASGMNQPLISRLEAPVGPLPDLDSVMRYVSACGGHLALEFWLAETAGSASQASERISARLV